MSELVPAQPTAAPVAIQDTDSWTIVAPQVAHLAEKIANTDFIPKGLRGNAPAVTAAILYGRETGLPPMTALSQIHVVEGKPGLSAEGMRALVLAAGHEIEIVETTGGTCTMRARRRGSETWTTITWTIDMARAAGVANKNVWKSYPRQMLQARCTTELSRLVFPDVIHGFRSVEELEDMGPETHPAMPAAPGRSTSRVGRGRAKAQPEAVEAAPPADGAPAAPPPAADLPPLPGEEPPHVEEVEDGLAPTSSTPDPVEVLEEVLDAEVIEEEPAEDPAPAPKAGPASRAQTRMLFAMLKGLDIETDAGRHDIAARILGRPVTSYADLTALEVSNLIDTLGMCKTADDLRRLLDTIEQVELPAGD